MTKVCCTARDTKRACLEIQRERRIQKVGQQRLEQVGGYALQAEANGNGLPAAVLVPTAVARAGQHRPAVGLDALGWRVAEHLQNNSRPRMMRSTLRCTTVLNHHLSKLVYDYVKKKAWSYVRRTVYCIRYQIDLGGRKEHETSAHANHM